MTNPSDFTLAQAADPSTPAAVLGEIATHRPDLRAAIASNPTAYPDLLDWLRSFGDPQIDAALAARAATPASPGQASQRSWDQPVQGGQQHSAPDTNGTQALPTGYGAYGVSPASPPAGESGGDARQWGTDASAGAGPWGASSQGDQSSWSPQGNPAASAWEQQSAPAHSQAWSQPGSSPVAAWGPPQPAAKKSRKGLWIGLGVAGVLVVAGGAFAANALWFSKVGGAETPEAAVTQMIDAAVAKDLVGIYGVTSPAEFDTMTTGLDLFTDQMEDSELDIDAITDLYEEYVDAFTMDLDGLEVEVEEIEDGLAKVRIVAGELTLDADPDALGDATVSAMELLTTGPFAELMDMTGETVPTEAELRDEIATVVAEAFPVDLTADDLEDPFLMVVQEGGSWYVSPTLTLLEYGAIAEGVERGTLPADDSAGQYDSPEAAADGLVAGVTEYIANGDEGSFLNALPLADRRALSLYGKFDEVDVAELEELQELLETGEIDASFTVRDEKDGVAWLQLETLTFAGEMDGEYGSIEIDGECLSADLNGQLINGCLDDIPALKELGLGDLSLIAIEEDGSWYITYAGTLGDASGVLLNNVMSLYDEGKLTDSQWWQDNLGVLGDELF